MFISNGNFVRYILLGCLIFSLVKPAFAVTRDANNIEPTSATEREPLINEYNISYYQLPDNYYPNALASDSEGRRIFVSGLNKVGIAVVKSKGSANQIFRGEVMIDGRSRSFPSVFALTYNENRDLLYACVGDIDPKKENIRKGLLQLHVAKNILNYYPFEENQDCSDLATDSAGNIYITDSTNPVIRKFDFNSKETTVWLERKEFGGKNDGLESIVYDGDKYFYVIKNRTGDLFRIEVNQPDRMSRVFMFRDLNNPMKIRMLDRDKNQFLITEATSASSRYAGGGRLLVVRVDSKARATSEILISGGLDVPSGIAVQKGVIYIAESQQDHLLDNRLIAPHNFRLIVLRRKIIED